MNVQTLVIRADATVAMGTGHVMRCLALAQAWQDAGGTCVFAMAESTQAVEDRIQAEGFSLARIEGAPGSGQDADGLAELARARGNQWVVVDGYQFGAEYQRKLKAAGMKVLFVDDNAHAEHYSADLVLNQNPHATESMYSNREAHTRLLLGPKYALLRREFLKWREWKREIPAVARKVLVTMGGSDPDNITLRVMRALAGVRIDGLEAVVVSGGSSPHFKSIEQAASGSPAHIRLVRNVSNMPELMAWADAAVSAAGSTSWEMCLLGLPAALIDLAENQVPVARELARNGTAIHLGSSQQVVPEEIVKQLERLCLSAELRSTMSQMGRELVDGRGAERVATRIQGKRLHLRPAEENDCRLLWEWANDPQVRAASFSTAPIPWEEHLAWFAGKMKDPNCLILIAEDEQARPVGQFRLDQKSREEGDIDVSLSREFRGCGYGSMLIELGVRRVFAETTAKRLHAFVKLDNQASLRAFEQANFRKLGTVQMKGNETVHYVCD